MILAALVALAASCSVDISRLPARYLPLESAIRQTMNRFSVPGLAIGVVRHGRVEVMRGYGIASIKRSELVTSCTLFHVASVTKLFTATAALRLASERRIGLDQPAVTYLPQLRSGSPELSRITVRQLLQHRSGIDDVFDYGWREHTSDRFALTRLVDSVARFTKPGTPGVSYSYSNIGYDLIGAIIQSVTSTAFESYVSSAVLRRAGMRSSTLLGVDPSLGWADPFVLDSTYSVATSPVYPYNRAHAPSSTLVSNVADLIRWMLALVDPRGERGTILPRAALREMMSPSREAGPDSIGLGWFVTNERGIRLAYHSGGDFGFSSFLIVAPDLRTGVVVVANFEQAPTADLATLALDLASDVSPTPLPNRFGNLLDQKAYQSLQAGRPAQMQRMVDSLRTIADPPFDFAQALQLYRLGQTYAKRSRYAYAAACFDAAAGIQPSVGFLRMAAVKAWLAAADTSAAVDRLRLMLSSGADSARARVLLDSFRR
jgi:CubicO group peptidase (beta-lactamase class C family)